MPETILVNIVGDAKQYIQELSKAEQGTQKFSKTSESSGVGLGKLKMGFLAVGAAIAGAAILVNKLTKAFMEQEKADLMLENSLKRIGKLEVFGELKRQAEAFQRTTTYGDELIQSAFTRLVDLTGNAEVAMSSMSTVTDLAAAKNLDLVQAADLVGRAANGNMGMLSRYGVTIEEVAAKGGGLNGVLSVLNEKFGGSAGAAAASFSGQLAILKNRLGEVAETLGSALMPIVTGLFNAIVPLVEGLVPQLVPLLNMVVELLNAILPPIMEFVNALLPPIMKILQAIMPFLTEIIQKLLPPLLKVLEAILMPLLQLVGEILPPILDLLTPIIDLLVPIFELVAELYSAILKPLMPLLSDLVKAILPALKPAIEVIAKALEWSIGLIIKAVEWLGKLLGLSQKAKEELSAVGANRGVGVAERAANIAAGKRPVKEIDFGGMAGVGAEAGGKGGEKGKPFIETENIFYQAEAGLVLMDVALEGLKVKFDELGEYIEKTMKDVEDTLRSFATSFNDIFASVFGEALKGLFDDTFGKLKIDINDSMNAFQKFGARMVNSIIEFMGQVVIQGIAWGALIVTLNAIAPGAGSAFAAMMGGLAGTGGALGGIARLFGSGKTIQGFDSPYNDMWIRKQGMDMARNFAHGMNEYRPQSAPASALKQGRPIIILSGSLGAFVDGIEGAEPMVVRKFAKEILKQTAKESARSIS